MSMDSNVMTMNDGAIGQYNSSSEFKFISRQFIFAKYTCIASSDIILFYLYFV